MSTAEKKFLFDTVFSDDEKEIPFSEIEKAAEEAMREAERKAEMVDAGPAEPEIEEEPEEPEPPTFSEEELAQARDEAFAAGKAEAAREAAAAMETVAAQALEVIAAKMDALREDVRDAREGRAGEGLAVAAAIVRKMLPAADPDLAGAEILQVVDTAMARIYEEPRVVIRVNDGLVEALEDKIRNIAERDGYPGALTVAPDPDLPVSDCRIEWGAGGVERDLGALWTEVEDIIHRNTGIDIADIPNSASEPLDARADDETAATEPPAPAEAESEPEPKPLVEPEAGPDGDSASVADIAPREEAEAPTVAEEQQEADAAPDDTALDAAFNELEQDIASGENTASPAPVPEQADEVQVDDDETGDTPNKPLGGNNG